MNIQSNFIRIKEIIMQLKAPRSYFKKISEAQSTTINDRGRNEREKGAIESMKEERGDELQRVRHAYRKDFLMKDRNERVSSVRARISQNFVISLPRAAFSTPTTIGARMRHCHSLFANYLFYARQYWICPYYWNIPPVIRFNAHAARNRRIRLISSELANRNTAGNSHLRKMTSVILPTIFVNVYTFCRHLKFFSIL